MGRFVGQVGQVGHLEQSDDNGWRVAGASLSVVKLVLGAAVFSLPYWFLKAGILGGSLAVGLMGVTAVLTLSMVIEVRRIISGEQDSMPAPGIDPEQTPLIPDPAPTEYDYGQMAHQATGMRWLASATRTATFISCMGSCAGYIAFVSDLVSGAAFVFNSRVSVAVALGPVLWLLLLARDRNLLTVLCSLGNVAFILAAFSVVVHGVLKGNSDEDWSRVHLPAIPGVLGNGAFLFTIHFCLPAITETQLKTPRERQWFVQRGIPGAIFFCVVSAILFATICVLTYGDSIMDNVVRNIPRGILGSLAIICLSFDLIFTYPLVLLPAENLLTSCGPESWSSSWVRIALVVSTVLMAMCIPNFAFLTAWIGCLSDTPQAFILPPLMYILCCLGSEWRHHLTMAATCVAICSCGVVLMLSGSVQLLLPTSDFSD